MDNQSKPIKDFTDIELAELLNTTYQQLMIQQQNLQSINNEILKRKGSGSVKAVPVVEEKPKE